MSLSLDATHIFLTVAEQGSFSAAGRHLGKAQSAISTSISNLELDLGVELFDRSPRSPVLTQAGRSLLRDARHLQSSAESFKSKAKNLVEGEANQLTLAIDASVYPMRGVYQTCQWLDKHSPLFELEILRATSVDVLELVSEGRAHLGVRYNDREAGDLYSHNVASIPVAVVAHPDHALAHQSKTQQLSMSDFHNHRQISYTSHHNPNAYSPISNRVWLVESSEDALNCVLNNFGWAYIPFPLARAYIETGKLLSLNCDFQQVDNLLNVELIWHPKTVLGKTGKGLIQQLSEYAIQG